MALWVISAHTTYKLIVITINNDTTNNMNARGRRIYGSRRNYKYSSKSNK